MNVELLEEEAGTQRESSQVQFLPAPPKSSQVEDTMKDPGIEKLENGYWSDNMETTAQVPVAVTHSMIHIC